MLISIVLDKLKMENEWTWKWTWIENGLKMEIGPKVMDKEKQILDQIVNYLKKKKEKFQNFLQRPLSGPPLSKIKNQ